MALPIGILLFILGSVAYYCWLPQTFYFLQGLTACSLLFWGIIAITVGYSERKARRECDAAMHDEVPGTTPASAAEPKPEAGPGEAQTEAASLS